MRKVLIAVFVLICSVGDVHADPVLHQQIRGQLMRINQLFRFSGEGFSRPQLEAASQKLSELEAILSGSSQPNRYGCFASESRPGKYYVGEFVLSTARLSNYFDSEELCQRSLSYVRGDLACQQSESRPGKTYLGQLAKELPGKIGNYYSDFEGCIRSIYRLRDNRLCMESERLPGQWYLHDIPSGQVVGGYMSEESCQRLL